MVLGRWNGPRPEEEDRADRKDGKIYYICVMECFTRAKHSVHGNGSAT